MPPARHRHAFQRKACFEATEVRELTKATDDKNTTQRDASQKKPDVVGVKTDAIE